MKFILSLTDFVYYKLFRYSSDVADLRVPIGQWWTALIHARLGPKKRDILSVTKVKLYGN